MLKPKLLFAIAMTFVSVCHAEDAPGPQSSLKVYRVGDLVSIPAMNDAKGGRITSECPGDGQPETTKRLDELKDIIESMCSRKPVAVMADSPSLSLIVRHSQDGHDEIDQILRLLVEASSFSIQMEYHELNWFVEAALEESEETEALRNKLHILLSKRLLTKAETIELLAFLPANVRHAETIPLRSGLRTAWEQSGMPYTVLGRVERSRQTVALRIGYQTGDDHADPPMFGSQAFSLADGQSALFKHYFDGGQRIWLVSAKILPDETSIAQTSHSDQ